MMKFFKELSTKPFWLFVITTVLIFVAEALIMFVIAAMPDLSPAKNAVIDSVMLTVIVFPLLYLTLFRPLLLNVNERVEAEKEIKRSRDLLEIRVKDRTEELEHVNKVLMGEIEVRKRVEEQLRKSEARLAEAQKIASIGNWDWDIKKNTLFWSDEIYRIFGKAPRSFKETYEAFLEIVHPDDRPMVEEAVSAALDERKHYGIDHRIVLPCGEVRTVHEEAKLEYGEDGEPVRMVGTVQDITERVRSEEEKERIKAQLMQAQKMEAVGQLTGGIAHDFNNMLTAIIGYANIMYLKLGEEDPLRKQVGSIIRVSEHAAELVKRLLAFSRMQIINPEPVDLNEIVSGVEKIVSRLLPEDITVEFPDGDSVLPVLADRGQMQQVLLNLATNARDVMPEGGAEGIDRHRGDGRRVHKETRLR